MSTWRRRARRRTAPRRWWRRRRAKNEGPSKPTVFSRPALYTMVVGVLAVGAGVVVGQQAKKIADRAPDADGNGIADITRASAWRRATRPTSPRCWWPAARRWRARARCGWCSCPPGAAREQRRGSGGGAGQRRRRQHLAPSLRWRELLNMKATLLLVESPGAVRPAARHHHGLLRRASRTSCPTPASRTRTAEAGLRVRVPAGHAALLLPASAGGAVQPAGR